MWHVQLRRALLSLAVLTAGCTSSQPARRDLLVAEDSVRAQSERFLAAWNARDADRVAALLTDDVVLLRAHNDPLMGPAQVKWYLRERVADAARQTWQPTSVIVAPSLEFAVERGVYRLQEPKTGPYALGNYVTVYRREGGAWRVQTDQKWLTDIVVGDSLCRANNDGTGSHACRKRAG